MKDEQEKKPQPGDKGKCTGEYRGCLGEGIWRIDPFAHEIYDEKNWEYLCDNCYQERVWDT
jgi:hypothetical protein